MSGLLAKLNSENRSERTAAGASHSPGPGQSPSERIREYPPLPIRGQNQGHVITLSQSEQRPEPIREHQRISSAARLKQDLFSFCKTHTTIHYKFFSIQNSKILFFPFIKDSLSQHLYFKLQLSLPSSVVLII